MVLPLFSATSSHILSCNLILGSLAGAQDLWYRRVWSLIVPNLLLLRYSFYSTYAGCSPIWLLFDSYLTRYFLHLSGVEGGGADADPGDKTLTTLVRWLKSQRIGGADESEDDVSMKLIILSLFSFSFSSLFLVWDHYSCE